MAIFLVIYGYTYKVYKIYLSNSPINEEVFTLQVFSFQKQKVHAYSYYNFLSKVLSERPWI